jgi:hypothetical protein
MPVIKVSCEESAPTIVMFPRFRVGNLFSKRFFKVKDILRFGVVVSRDKDLFFAFDPLNKPLYSIIFG